MHGCGYMPATAKPVQNRSLGAGGGDLHGRLADAKLCRDEWVFWCSSRLPVRAAPEASARRGRLKVRRMGVKVTRRVMSCSSAAFSELSRKVKPAVESSARLTWVSASPLNPV